MNSISEYCTIGHPDRTADCITSYLLDEYIRHDPKTRFALEVQLKDHICNLAGEVTSTWRPTDDEIAELAREAIRKVGYTAEYAARWPDGATLNADKVTVNSFIGQQSPDIAQGVDREGWGDQGCFMGMATHEAEYGYMPRDRYFAHTIGKKLYDAALKGYAPIGLDIKVLVSLNPAAVEQVVIAAPMLPENESSARAFIERIVYETLSERNHKMCDELIINGTGAYVIHSSVGDAGVVGRKLAVDFYGLNCPIGGGCVDAETEYLAPDGWHRFDSYKGGKIAQVNNIGEISFVSPTQYIKTFHNNVYEIGTKNTVSMVLSGNHNVFYRTSKKNYIKKQVAEIIKMYHRSKQGHHAEIPLTFTFDFSDGIRKYKNEYMIRFLVAHCADGTIMNYGKGTLCRIRVKKQHKIDLLRAYLPKTGLNWEERHYADGYTYFYYRLSDTSKMLHEHFKNPDLETARILSEEVFRWDGDEDRLTYRTTIKEEADFVQFILSGYLGKTVTILKHRLHENRTYKEAPMYGVSILDRKFSTPFRKGGKSKTSNNILRRCPPQMMYCFTVPTGLLLARRKNHIFITGNSPWGKDGTKADVTLNLYARYRSLKTMLCSSGAFNAVFTKIGCCIGQRRCLLIQEDQDHHVFREKTINIIPSETTKLFGLDGSGRKDMFFPMCKDGLFSHVDAVAKKEVASL